jgi:hypothetical protein
MNSYTTAKRSICVSALIVGAALLAWADIVPVLSAEARLDATATPAVQAAIAARVDHDVTSYWACADSDPLSRQYRDCAIEAMHQVQTDAGATVLIGRSRDWLRDHPNDTEFKDAASKAIEAGWAEILRQRPIESAVQNVAMAKNKSVLVRVTGGRSWSDEYDAAGALGWRVEQLLTAERSVQTPQLFEKEIARRVHFLLGS